MPAKLDPTKYQRRERVRQEGRRGTLEIPFTQQIDLGDQGLDEILNYINFQLFKSWRDEANRTINLYGYCPLFEPLLMEEKSPVYTMRVSLDEAEPIVEMFKRR